MEMTFSWYNRLFHITSILQNSFYPTTIHFISFRACDIACCVQNGKWVTLVSVSVSVCFERNFGALLSKNNDNINHTIAYEEKDDVENNRKFSTILNPLPKRNRTKKWCQINLYAHWLRSIWDWFLSCFPNTHTHAQTK